MVKPHEYRDPPVRIGVKAMPMLRTSDPMTIRVSLFLLGVAIVGFCAVWMLGHMPKFGL